jgi:5,5'-dehydrodivanillate O-demethylase
MVTDTFEELVHTGLGTSMGALLRKFWQPVAVASSIAPGSAAPIRVLGERLTLYRGESGQPHIVAERCAHRRTLLQSGWVEGERIRCMYHGWLYDAAGQCVEMPAEDPSFPPKVQITAYPAREYGGLIFAYLGEGEPSEFPVKPELDRDGVGWAYGEVWPCNWLQGAENSLDSVHVAFVHQRGRFGKEVTNAIPTLEVQETDFGIQMIAPRSADNVRINDFHWPNCIHIVLPDPTGPAKPWFDRFVWYVPVDDEHHMEMRISRSPVTGEDARTLERWLHDHPPYDPGDHHDALFRGLYPPAENTQALVNAEDYVTVVGQGRIVDRRQEHLGASDRGVLLFRRLLERELIEVREGQPTKDWVYPKEAADLPSPPVPSGAGA